MEHCSFLPVNGGLWAMQSIRRLRNHSMKKLMLCLVALAALFATPALSRSPRLPPRRAISQATGRER